MEKPHFSFLFKDLPIYVFICCVWLFCLHVYLSTTSMHGVCRGQSASEPLVLGLQTLVSLPVGAGHQSRVLGRDPGLLITAFPPGLIIAILKINYAFKYIKSIIILEKWINSHTPFPPAPAPHILPSAWPRWVTEANTEPGSRSVSNWLRGHAMWLLRLALCWADPFPCSKGTMLSDRILKMDFLYFCSFL